MSNPSDGIRLTNFSPASAIKLNDQFFVAQGGAGVGVEGAATAGQIAQWVLQTFSGKSATVLQTGGDPSGVADSSAAFRAAALVSSVTTGIVEVTDGTWYLASDVNSTATFKFSPGASLAGPGLLFAPIDIGAVLPRANTLANVLYKMKYIGGATVACYGDSKTYGQDTTSAGVPGSQINGAGQTRSTQQWPENLQQALSFIGTNPAVTVYNRGFPGDTTRDGLRRWNGYSTETTIVGPIATDIAILSYGTNDADNFGNTGAIPLADYRRNLRLMAFREILKGAAVVILGPDHVQVPNLADNIRPYALAAREVAAEVGAQFVDLNDILSTLTNRYSDGVHNSSFGYAEIGWQLAALFSKFNGGLQSVSGGEIFYPDDQLGRGGASSVVNNSAAKGNGRLINLAPGDTYLIGVDCVADVIPVIHSFNVSGVGQLGAYYSGGGSATRGVPVATLMHNSSVAVRMSLPCTELKRGPRYLILRNDGSVAFQIESIEFVGKDYLHTSYGILAKSRALSGARQPVRFGASLSSWWTAADYGTKLSAPYSIAAALTLSGTANNGLAVYATTPIAGEVFSPNALFILRNGSTLIVRDYVNGTPNDTQIGNIFPASGDWTGEIHIDVASSGVTVYVNGTQAGSSAVTVTNLSGFPGLIADKSVALQCHALSTAGAVKGPY